MLGKSLIGFNHELQVMGLYTNTEYDSIPLKTIMSLINELK